MTTKAGGCRRYKNRRLNGRLERHRLAASGQEAEEFVTKGSKGNEV